MNKIIHFFKNHYKIITYITLSLLIIFTLKYVIYISKTDTAYYLNKDTYQRITTRIRIRPIEIESEIQAYLREYLSGSTDYTTKIPFTSETTLLSTSHDLNNQVLVLNWNSYFYRALEYNRVDEEIELLLLSIKKNFPIKQVYFLVEGTEIVWDWKDINLKDAIDLSLIEKK